LISGNNFKNSHRLELYISCRTVSVDLTRRTPTFRQIDHQVMLTS